MSTATAETKVANMAAMPLGRLAVVPLASVRPFSKQPRKHFDQVKLRELADSIDAVGQLLPAVVRELEGQRHDYELVDGQRRWHACKMAKVDQFKVIVVEVTGEADQFAMSVLANFCRADHTPLEVARAIHRFHKEGLTQTEIAKRFGLSQPWVGQHLKLMRLSPKVHAMMEPDVPERDRLGMMAALLLADLPEKVQVEAAVEIVEKHLTANRAARLLRAIAKRAGLKIGGKTAQKPVHDYRLLRSFVERLRQDLDPYDGQPRDFFNRMFENRRGADKQAIVELLGESIDQLVALRESLGGAGKAAGSRLELLRSMAERGESLFGGDDGEDDG